MDARTVTGRAHARQAGFTLLGLLFMIAAMGAGMAALGTMWQTAAQREKESELLFIGSQYRQAIESFWNRSPANARRLPKNFSELLSDPRFPNTVRHLRRIYRDPMTRAADWGLAREPDGGISGVYSLSGAKPMKRAGFAAGEENFQDASSYRDWVFRFDSEKPVGENAGAQEKPAAGKKASAATALAKPQ